ncbi:protein lifeguard 4 [Tribolium castaneum]|uniref:Protein lifeguard 4-like Protein n=1 Tax=Tribolium castaneum TaxID=7070 RepID=D6WLJ9_TRICA|nr:PREDICTED: protein lifeguard 4 [Tribolium castaneum]EFA03439.1 Protein lifeguard 4-like Protein [Tribolium castaneum]|eukprot:XP_969476.1 PREDICTED: protein lifeguard 4 [Tribolium castaneum]
MSSTVPLILEEDCERGGKDFDEEGIENDFAYRNNVMQASKTIRLGFIRKVYGLLSMQLLLTIVVASIFMFTPQIKTFVHENDWMLLVSFIPSIFLLIALIIKRRDTPANLILLAAFTVVEAYTVGVILTYYSQAVVLQALLLTLVIVGSLTFYTFQTKRDFSAMYSGLFAGLGILIVGGFLQIFFHSSTFEIVISLGGAFLFCLFIIFDTQMMMQTLSAEEYILATINLYLDIINLFLYILRILQAMNRQ